MRTRFPALVALGVVLSAAWFYRGALPDGQAFFRDLRQQVQPATFYFHTIPETPAAFEPFTMQAAVVRGENQPVEGLRLTAHCSSPDHPDRAMVLQEKSPGRYEAETWLAPTGHWQVELIGEKGSWRQHTKFELNVSEPARGGSPREDDD
ncbi:MAG: FixH family protein [Acidobacteriota bacterium]|nr:FixH family protein [Acidobacteriota bacterium]